MAEGVLSDVPDEATGKGSQSPIEAKKADPASPPPPTMADKATEQREVAMTEQRGSMAAEGRAVQRQHPSGTGSPSPPRREKADAVPPLTSTVNTLSRDEEGVIATRKPCQTAKALENKEFGAGIAAFGVSMIVAWSFLSPEDRGAHNLRCIIPMFLSFACIASGASLMFLSMNILGLPENIVADVQEMASKWLSLLCTTLPVVTLLSPLVLSGYKFYRYIGLALLVILTAPIGLLRWYIRCRAEEADEQAEENEHEAQLEATFKFISAIINSASGGFVALIVNYNVTDGSGRTKGALLLAIFCIFTTAIWGLLSMEIRTKVLEIKSPKFRGFIIQAMCLCIMFMLLSLACAVLAEVFAIVGFYVIVAFTPWIFASVVYLYRKLGIHRARVPRDNSSNVSLEVLLNLKADRGIKITMWSFLGIIGIFGGFLRGPLKIEHLKACIILLASAFMSGFALTVLTVRPNSTSTNLAAATTVLDWTAAATFTSAIFAVIIATILEMQ